MRTRQDGFDPIENLNKSFGKQKLKNVLVVKLCILHKYFTGVNIK